MLQAVIYYIVTVILTKELVIATDQCTEYQFKSPFFPGKSCEDIYNKNPESHDWSAYYWITDGPSRVYCGMTYTGSSCEDIKNNNPGTGDKSGYYRINDDQWTYCNMIAITISGDFISTCAGVGGGWRRIANVNISAGDDCPGEWRKATRSGVSFCRVASNDSFTCSSANFSTNGMSYQSVCGRARGYQKGDSLGFHHHRHGKTIDKSYVSGLSITYSSNPRQHIWTFASGSGEKLSERFSCPCTINSTYTPPYAFVGSNYYCKAASWYCCDYDTYFFNDTLWDGAGCVDNCCDDTTQPWFYRPLNQTTQDDIEVRICTRGPFWYRSVLIDQLELYIQ